MIWWVRAALALAILAFVPGLSESFEPPKVAVVRVCGFALLAALLAGRGPRLRLQILDVAVLVWLSVEALAAGFSTAPLLSVLGEPAQREGLLTSIGLAGIYLGTRATAGGGDPETQQATLRWMVAAAVGAAAVGLLQRAGLDPLAGAGAPAPSRPVGTLGHPNLLGVVTAAALAVALVRAILGGPARGHYRTAVAILAAATFATLARGAWFAAGVGALVAVGLAVRVRPEARPWRHVALWAAGAVVALAAVAWAAGWGGWLGARGQDILFPMAASGSGRLELWRTAWDAWLARPLLGHGPDTFDLVFPRFQSADYWRLEWGGLPLHAHSVPLHLLATRGILGLLSAAFLAGAALIAARTAWIRTPASRPLIAALVAMLAVCAAAGWFWVLGIAGAVIATVGSACLANLVMLPRGILPLPTAPQRPRRATRVAPLVAGGLAAAVGLADLASSAAARGAAARLDLARASAGETARAARRRALASAGRAVRLAPLDDAVHRLRAAVLLDIATASPDPAPGLVPAVDAARRAVRLVPARAANQQQLARALAARAVRGDTAAAAGAHRAIGRIAQLAPVDGVRLVEGARLELAMGHATEARALARRVSEIYPEDARAATALAEAAFAMGDAAGAAAALRRAFSGDWHGDTDAEEAARSLRARLP